MRDEVVILPYYRVMGEYEGQKVQLSSNIPIKDIADRVMQDIALMHPELTDLYVEEYKEFHL